LTAFGVDPAHSPPRTAKLDSAEHAALRCAKVGQQQTLKLTAHKPMSEVTTYALRCPRCGGSLAVAKSLETFTCEYCGSSVQVQRQGGAVSLALLGDAIQMVQRGTDKTAAELAIRRISEESAVRDRQRAKLVEERKAQEGFWRVKIYAKKNDGNFWLLASSRGSPFGSHMSLEKALATVFASRAQRCVRESFVFLYFAGFATAEQLPFRS
jgi:ribosomal protein S27AE